MNLPAAYTTSVSGKGRELERTFREIPARIRLIDRVHVHDSGIAIREPDLSS